MVLLRPVSALRFLTLAVTVLLVTALFLEKGPFWLGFILGMAAGLSIAVQAMVWNKQLQWLDEPDRGDTIQMNLNQPMR